MKKIILGSLTILTIVMCLFCSCNKVDNLTGSNCVDTLKKVITPAFSALTTVQSGATSTEIYSVDVKPFCESKKVLQLVVQPVLANMTPSNQILTNVSLYYKGSQIGSTQTFNGVDPLVYNLGSQLILLQDSVTTIVVKADIRTSIGAPYTSGFILVKMSIPVGELIGMSTANTNVNVIKFPESSGLIITNGSLLVARNSSFANQSTSPNTNGVRQGSYILQNTSSDVCRIISLQVGLGGTTPLSNLSNLLFNDNIVASNPIALPQATNTFSTNMLMNPSTTKEINILCDQGSVTGTTVITNLKVTYLNLVTNVVGVSDVVTGQTMTIAQPTINQPTFVTAQSTVPMYVPAGNGGAVDATQATYNFTSSTGAGTITELKFQESALGTMTSVKINGTVSAAFVAGVAWFQGLNIPVPAGAAGANVQALQSYANVGVGGTTSGTNTKLILVGYKYTAGGVTTDVVTSISANTMKLVGSVPHSSVSGVIHTGLINAAEVLIAETTVTADAHGNVSSGVIKWNVGNSGFTSGFGLTSVRTADGTGTTIPTAATVVHTGSDYVTSTFSTQYVVPAGTTVTFRIYGIVSGVMTPTAMLSTTIDQPGFIWTDVIGAGTASAENGNLIYNFPANAYILKR